ncbi:phage tail tape measure protein [Cupriavidus sp. H18C1]|uniref:phage tail tape measure protein n=1 Tax=Cupriavidus sp. H18C1 TaxID=3241601 RepID=UPI003BB8CDD1
MADKFQLKALITGVDKLSPALAGIRKNVAGFRKALKADGLGDLSFRDVIQGGALAAPVVAATRAAIDFESAMADVRKVVDFETPAQFKEMGDEILGMSKRLPMAAKDIAAITAAGGQAGIARDELPRFTEDAVKMGVAFDQSADQAGDMMAKWRTAFKLGQDQVVALADQINYLGNTGPANARQISEIVTRIGPLGEVAGLAAGQIAAMGATLAGMGVGEEIAATGMKNFMLALTAGTSATKEQQATFKALRLDSKQLATAMQKDAEGTVMRVLTAISKVDKDKQAAVLDGLFGKESIGAIAPLLTNMDLLRQNFRKVGDATAYAGSMSKEYEARAATTANALQLMRNRAAAVGIAVGNILLPPLNDFLAFAGPLVDGMSDFAAANPEVIKGVLGVAVGLGVLKLAVVGVTTAMRVFNAVTGLSPIGIAVRVIAGAAGLLIANWSAVAPFFASVWGGIKGAAETAWGWIRGALNFTPLGLIINNWGSLTEFFGALWDTVRALTAVAWDGVKALILSYTPLGWIVSNWEPIVDWFRGLWDRVRPYIEPLMSGAQWVGQKVGAFFGGGQTDGGTAGADGNDGGGGQPARGVTAAVGTGLRAGTQRLRDWSASLSAQSAQTQQLRGDMVVRFEGAPPGTRVDPGTTNQPGLTITPRVGYRSLAAS